VTTVAHVAEIETPIRTKKCAVLQIWNNITQTSIMNIWYGMVWYGI